MTQRRPHTGAYAQLYKYATLPTTASPARAKGGLCQCKLANVDLRRTVCNLPGVQCAGIVLTNSTTAGVQHQAGEMMAWHRMAQWCSISPLYGNGAAVGANRPERPKCCRHEYACRPLCESGTAPPSTRPPLILCIVRPSVRLLPLLGHVALEGPLEPHCPADRKRRGALLAAAPGPPRRLRRANSGRLLVPPPRILRPLRAIQRLRPLHGSGGRAEGAPATRQARAQLLGIGPPLYAAATRQRRGRTVARKAAEILSSHHQKVSVHFVSVLALA